MRKVTLSLLGAAAVAASVLLVRQQKQIEPKVAVQALPESGEETAKVPSIDRLRELGM